MSCGVNLFCSSGDCAIAKGMAVVARTPLATANSAALLMTSSHPTNAEIGYTRASEEECGAWRRFLLRVGVPHSGTLSGDARRRFRLQASGGGKRPPSEQQSGSLRPEAFATGLRLVARLVLPARASELQHCHPLAARAIIRSSRHRQGLWAGARF